MAEEFYRLSSDDKEIIAYFYERNKQIYSLLGSGVSKSKVAELFDLSVNSIKTMWKKHKHTYPKHYQLDLG